VDIDIYIITIKNYHLIKRTINKAAPAKIKVLPDIPNEDKDVDNVSVAV